MMMFQNYFAKSFLAKFFIGDKVETDNYDSKINLIKKDTTLWNDDVGSLLHDMLERAGYPPESTELHTEFFNTSVAPSLGPHPRGTGRPKSWESFMTDDHTPVEVSWCWSTSMKTPTVRYSVEPIGHLAGQAVDPINTAASLRLLGQSLPLAPELDLFLHRHFQRSLMTKDVSSNISKSDTPLSQSFMAFDLLQSSIVVKQYYLPGWKASKEGTSKFDIVDDATKRLPVFSATMAHSYNVFSEFLATFPEQLRPAVEIVAIDCLEPAQSRLKIYVRYRETTLASVLKMLTLGGRVPKTQEEQASLRELWCLVFGLDQKEHLDSLSLPGKDHRTGGILYYYEFKGGSSMPKSKVYLPVRHYAQEDDQIARGLSQYLDRRGKGLATGSYYDSVQQICKHRSLSKGLGFHTYVCWASDKDNWNVTAYFNPEVYHESRMVTK